MIGVIDYKMGNLASLYNSFNFIDTKIKIITKPEEIKSCSKLILPGVGGFEEASMHLMEYGFDEAIKEFVKSGKYLFGICLGMQLLCSSSQEGDGQGLCLIDATVKRFSCNLKIPHMGWNKVFKQKDSKLLQNIADEFYLYFVHSYHVVLKNSNDALLKTDYGYSFASAIEAGNIFGIQPHPEKSHRVGLQILKNFAKLWFLI